MTEEAPTKKKEPRWVKFFTEYLPLLFFVGAYLKGDLNLAIKVIVISTCIAIVLAIIVVRRVPILPVLVASSVVLFGGLAVIFENDDIYKMKPTVLNSLFGVILLGGLPFKQMFLERAMGDSLQLPREAWLTITYRYSALFFSLAAVNEVVWRTMSEEFWVGFKMVGPIGIIILFTLAHIPFFKKHGLE